MKFRDLICADKFVVRGKDYASLEIKTHTYPLDTRRINPAFYPERGEFNAIQISTGTLVFHSDDEEVTKIGN